LRESYARLVIALIDLCFDPGFSDLTRVIHADSIFYVSSYVKDQIPLEQYIRTGLIRAYTRLFPLSRPSRSFR